MPASVQKCTHCGLGAAVDDELRQVMEQGAVQSLAIGWLMARVAPADALAWIDDLAERWRVTHGETETWHALQSLRVDVVAESSVPVGQPQPGCTPRGDADAEGRQGLLWP